MDILDTGDKKSIAFERALRARRKADATIGDARCHSCRYWSDRVARITDSHLQAQCLHELSPAYGSYTYGDDGCDASERGVPIDE